MAVEEQPACPLGDTGVSAIFDFLVKDRLLLVMTDCPVQVPGLRLPIPSGIMTATSLATTLSLSRLRAKNAQGFVQRSPFVPTLLGLATKAVPVG